MPSALSAYPSHPLLLGFIHHPRHLFTCPWEVMAWRGTTTTGTYTINTNVTTTTTTTQREKQKSKGSHSQSSASTLVDAFPRNMFPRAPWLPCTCHSRRYGFGKRKCCVEKQQCHPQGFRILLWTAHMPGRAQGLRWDSCVGWWWWVAELYSKVTGMCLGLTKFEYVQCHHGAKPHFWHPPKSRINYAGGKIRCSKSLLIKVLGGQ